MENIFITKITDSKYQSITNDLKDIPYAIGDYFSVKNVLSTGGSKTLSNYIPIFDATVVQKLNDSEAIMTAKTIVSEFGIENELVEGAALAVKEKLVTFGLGNDTNSSVRKSAGLTGIIGYKPTYGLISRYGLYAVASVFDTIGIYTNSVQEAAVIANYLKGLDENDMNTWNSQEINLVKNITTDSKAQKLFYIKELTNPEFLKILKEQDIKASEVSIDNNLIKAIKTIHNTIMNAEITTTLANLTGIPFGPSGKGSDADTMMINYRTNNLESSTKKRLVMGTYTLGKDTIGLFYNNSLRLRRLITEELNKLFTKYDALISNNDEINLLLANLGGYPSIAIHNNLVITGKQKDDANILNIAYNLEGEGK